VKQLLNLHNNADSLAINWLMFGSNNLKYEPSGLILENYTKCASELSDLVKCFVRPQKTINATNPHHYNMMDLDRCNGTNHKKIKANCSINKHKEHYALSYAYIAHYVYQSEESYTKRKIILPADDTGTFRQGVNNLQMMHDLYNDVENTYPKDKYAKNVESFLNKITET
jgi:hypothetical protein